MDVSDIDNNNGHLKHHQLDLLKLAESVQHANLKDEETVRYLVNQVSDIVNVPVSQEKEDKIVYAIVNGNIPLNLSTLTKLFNY
jgi:hypothetical protein